MFERERRGLVEAGLLEPAKINDKRACEEAFYRLLKRIFP